MTTTLDEQIRDIGRELGMRRSCYPRWVASGKLKKETADHQIACMEDVYALLKSLKAVPANAIPHQTQEAEKE
jgi:hypothetical protein